MEDTRIEARSVVNKTGGQQGDAGVENSLVEGKRLRDFGWVFDGGTWGSNSVERDAKKLRETSLENPLV